jgi:hypothetical protein
MLTLPPAGGTDRQVANRVNQLIEGRSNAIGEVTLAAGTTTTTVNRAIINANGAPFLVPQTANAAAEIGAGTLYVSAVTAGSFTITHANNAQTDRTYFYIFLGG